MAVHVFDITTDFSDQEIFASRIEAMCNNPLAVIAGGCTGVDVNPKGQPNKVVCHFVNGSITAGDLLLLGEVSQFYDPADGPVRGARDMHGVELTGISNIDGLADDEVLGMVGGVLGGVPLASIGGVTINMLRRNTVLTGVQTDPVVVNFDGADRALDATYFEDTGGILLAKSSFTAMLELTCSVAHVSGADPAATLILRRNAGEVVGKGIGACSPGGLYTQLTAKGIASFVQNNELSCWISTNLGEVTVPALTATLTITILETA